DLIGGGGPGVGDDDRDRRFLAGLGAGAEHAVAARHGETRLAGDLQRNARVGGGILGGGLDRNRIAAGADRARRPDLELDALGLAGLDRNRRQLLAAVLLGEARLEVLRRLRRERDDEVAA